MGFVVVHYAGTWPCWRLSRLPGFRVFSSSETAVLRWQVLEQIDKELSKGDDRAALSLVKDLQGKPGGLRCFGAARQVPQRLYSLDELKLNRIEASSLLSPVDATLGSIERNLQLAGLVGGITSWNVFGLNMQQIFYFSVGLLFIWTLDAVSLSGGISSLILDTIGHTFSQKYRNRVVQHEAGHFLVAYLLGILPRGYTLTSLEAWKKEGSLNVQAGTAFVDFEFLEEVNSGKLTATMLNRFSCIALAGVAAEYLLYGQAEGGLGDINKANMPNHTIPAIGPPELVDVMDKQWWFLSRVPGRLTWIRNHPKLDMLLKSLGFTQKKADSQVRWAVLNTVLTLRRHEGARVKLAEAMSEGRSVGFCIDVIEKTTNAADI